MKLLPTNCPRCNAEQNFQPHTEPDTHGWLDKVVRCTMCGWKSVIDFTTPEIEAVWIKLQGYNRRMQYETDRNGQPQSSTVDGQRRMRKEYLRLRQELRDKIIKAGGSTAPHPDAA